MRRLKVLHVIPSVSRFDGGPARAITVCERALRREGVDVTTLTSDFQVPPNELEANGRVYKSLWSIHYKFSPGMVLYLIKHLKEFDIVHIHALFSFSSTAAGLLARLIGVPYIVRPLGTLSKYGITKRRPLIKRLSLTIIEGPILKSAAALHFTSEDEAIEAQRLGFRLRNRIVPLGVEPVPNATRQATEQIKGPLRGRKFILFLSRLDPKKNIELLIDAVACSEQLRSECALLIAGSGEASYIKELSARADTAGIAEITRWLGHVEGEEKAATLQAADIFVLPSISENFGIAAVEAMLAGLPCVLSEGVAIAREAENAGAAEITGLAVNQLRLSIERLIENDALRRRLSIRARAFSRERYSAESMGKALVDFYLDIARTA